jgi:hypothetical protein
MNFYQVFGLNIESELSIPGLLPTDNDPLVSIRPGKVGLPWESPDQERLFLPLSGGFLMGWQKYGSFEVRNGSEIIADPVPGCDMAVFYQILTGPVIAMLLYQRGLSIFHATTVEIDEGGVAFLASKGHGKSTQAASFISQGKRLVSDDLLVLQYQGGRPFALPGIPNMKLWPEALQAIGENPEQYPVINSIIEKRSYQPGEKFVTGKVPVRALFVLELGEQLYIQRLSKQEALRRMFQHWYGALFNGELLPLLGVARQFRECARLVDCVPVFQLKRPVSLSLLPTICQEVECHVSAIKS